jgi:hypothetical protein
MRRRAYFLSGFATGYVLGAKAGRQRYEQIMRTYRSISSNPKVQEASGKVQAQAGDLLGSAKDKVGEKVGEAKHKVEDKVRHRDDEPQPTGQTTWAGSNGQAFS